MEENNKEKQNISGINDGVQVLRTYTSDMADVIRNNDMTVAKIAMEEKRKNEEDELYRKASGTKGSKIFFLITGIILIGVAIFGIYYVLQKNKETPATSQKVENVSTFISYDSSAYIDVTDVNTLSGLLTLLEKEGDTDKTIKAFFFTEKVNITSGKTTIESSKLINSENFINLVETSIPSALLRSLDDSYLLGEYMNINDTGTGNKPSMFLIFKTTNYNQSYASMLEWEETMLKDLYSLFNISVSNSELFEKPWEDIIINNRDARVLYGANGEALLYYLFINRDKFIITTSVDALQEVVERLLIKNT